MRSLSQDVLFFAAMMNKIACVTVLFLIGWIVWGCFALDLLPVASFTQSEKSGISPLLVTFNASASTSAQGTLVSYLWNFGDGSTGQGAIVSHSYQTAELRTFTVTLQIVDHLGQTASSQAEVTVQPRASEPTETSIAFVWPFHFDAEGNDADNLNDEYFALQNTGSMPIDLSGWRIENEEGVSYPFPAGVQLAPGEIITVHSGQGVNSSTQLFLNASHPVWDNENDLAFLLNAAGEIVAHYVIATC